MKRSSHTAFTLIELVVSIAIVGTLVAMLAPAGQRALAMADRAKCTGNLRQLAVIVQTAAQDNDNHFPRIENDPTDPIHGGDDAGKVWTLPELVQSQGASTDILKCPADIRNAGKATGRSQSYYHWKGSSYEWLPFFEDELVSSPTIRGPFGQFTVPLSHVRLLMDYAENSEGPHNRGVGTSSMNVLYADGHVKTVVLSDEES